MCLFIPQLLQNGEPQRAEILRDDSPWNKEGFRLKNIRIRRTISRKIACIAILCGFLSSVGPLTGGMLRIEGE